VAEVSKSRNGAGFDENAMRRRKERRRGIPNDFAAVFFFTAPHNAVQYSNPQEPTQRATAWPKQWPHRLLKNSLVATGPIRLLGLKDAADHQKRISPKLPASANRGGGSA